MSFDIKLIPESIPAEDFQLTKRIVPMKEQLSKDFSTTHKDADWLRAWCGSEMDGWFQSPKGIFIVQFPYFTAINRVRLETLCGSQEIFDKVCPVIMYTMWKVTKRIRASNKQPV